MEVELKMGSSIIPKAGLNYFVPGVVGPFVKMKCSNNTYFITASHVVTQRLMYSKTFAGSPVFVLLYGVGKTRRCGRVFAGNKKRDKAAMVRVSEDLVPNTERFMRSTNFQFAGISPINFPTFDNRDSENVTKVVVFGRQTRAAYVKIVADNAKGWLYLYTNETGLFKFGEAGSAVFVVDKHRTLHCVGICTGGKVGDPFLFVIAPIDMILENLAKEIGKPLEIASL